MGEFEMVFKCPFCSSAIEIVGLKSLVCSNNHTFDIAKQGYVNLMAHPITTKYDKELFESRKIIADSGFFELLNKMMSELIKREVRSDQR